jgi:hypothetical protein
MTHTELIPTGTQCQDCGEALHILPTEAGMKPEYRTLRTDSGRIVCGSTGTAHRPTDVGARTDLPTGTYRAGDHYVSLRAVFEVIARNGGITTVGRVCDAMGHAHQRHILAALAMLADSHGVTVGTDGPVHYRHVTIP